MRKWWARLSDRGRLLEKQRGRAQAGGSCMKLFSTWLARHQSLKPGLCLLSFLRLCVPFLAPGCPPNPVFIHTHPSICGEFFVDSGEAEGRREKRKVLKHVLDVMML